MWIFSEEGFYSVVAHKTLPNTFMVRSREQCDIENLVRLCDLTEPVITTPDADYPFRVVVSGEVKDLIILALASGIDYSNFKDRVHHRPDQANKDRAYMEVWATMRRIQEPVRGQPSQCHETGFGRLR